MESWHFWSIDGAVLSAAVKLWVKIFEPKPMEKCSFALLFNIRKIILSIINEKIDFL